MGISRYLKDTASDIGRSDIPRTEVVRTIAGAERASKTGADRLALTGDRKSEAQRLRTSEEAR
jgi:hypothetical protein